MYREERKRQEEEPMPRVREPQQVEYHKTYPAACDEGGVINPGALHTYAHRSGHTDSGIGFHVAYIIDIQYSYTETADGDSRKEKNH